MINKYLKFFKKNIFLTVLLLVAEVLLGFYHFRGFNPQDEAWILYGASRFLQGDIPYKDFQFLYTPGTLYLTSLAFLIFGKSILSERIFAYVLSTLCVFLLLFLSKKTRASKFLTILVVGNFLFWGPGHINFIWPVMLIIPTFLLIQFSLEKMVKPSNQDKKHAILAGALVSSAILIKQNFGAVMLLFTFLIFLTHKMLRKKKEPIIFFIIAMFFVLFAQFTYMLLSESLMPFLKEMYDFVFQQAITGKGFHYLNPWDYPSPLHIKVAKVFFYLFPLGFFIYSTTVFLTKKSVGWTYSVFGILFYLAGIRPVLDLMHFTPVLAYTSLILYFLFPLIKTRQKGIVALVFVGFLLLGIYSSLFRNYFKWFTPISQSSVFWNHPRAKIWISQNDIQIASDITSYVHSNSKTYDYFYVYGLYPIYYFLLDAKNPTRFATIETRNVTGKNLTTYKNQLIKNRPSLIMTDGKMQGINPEIESFIQKNYTQSAEIHEKIFYKPRR